MGEPQAAALLARVLNNVAKYAVALGLGGSAIGSAMYNVDGGERAVIFDRFRGVLPNVSGEGTHFLVPWVQRAHTMDIRVRPRSIPSATGTKDLQMVEIVLRVLTRPDMTHLSTIFRNLGTDYDERVLPSITNEVLKAVVAQYNAEELLTKREDVSEKIKSSLTKRAQDFNLVIEDVAITHLQFGVEFSKAIEQKQVAEQEAERAKYIVQRSDQERKAAIVKAEGESEAARLISEATRQAGPGMIELRRIEAAKEIAASLGRSRNISYLPGGNNTLIGINPSN
mmetsp:Transcript_14846/g.37719  ORF Transcript_14846/g.37719 Transcript_14846/m.37719 type:complete len:283 (+) Transcript_14846:108-956(+)